MTYFCKNIRLRCGEWTGVKQKEIGRKAVPSRLDCCESSEDVRFQMPLKLELAGFANRIDGCGLKKKKKSKRNSRI